MPPKNDKTDYNSLRDGLPRYATEQFNLGVGVSTPAAPNDLVAYDVAPTSSGGRKPGVDSLSGLRALPEVRPIPWVPGKELPVEKSTESPRTQTRGAFLLSTRGNINSPPCTHCASGSGRFAACISMGEWFHGACSTCQMATRGNLCSLRTGRDESVPMNKSFELEASRTPTLGGYNQAESSLKRKRSTPTSTPSMGPNAQLPPQTYSNFAQQPQSSPSGFTPSNIPASNRLVGGQAPSSSNYTYQAEKTTSWQERATPYQAQSNLGQERRVAQNQPQSNHGGQYGAPGNTYNGAGAAIGRNIQDDQGRDPSTSISPSTQLLQQAPQDRPAVNTDHISSQTYRRTTSPFTPLIDTLPRNKQKRIFGIIGGIQSGIRSVRQQTNDLQKQLDLLQSELGIDTEDDNGDG